MTGATSAALDALDAEIAAVDHEHAAPAFAGPGAGGDAAPPALVATVSEEKQLSGIFTTLATMGAPMFPSIGKIYTEHTINSIAQALAPVFRKRGWSVSGACGKYAEEIAAVAVILPVAMATYSGIRADIAAANAGAGKGASGTAGDGDGGQR